MPNPSPPVQRLSERSLERLRRLEADHARLFTLRQPLTAALLVALSKDTAELAARAGDTVEPYQAIHAVAEAQVRKAIAGDTAAFTAIVDRIEGKPGLRNGDHDETSDRHATEVQATIEGVVEALTNQRLAQPVDVEVLIGPLDADGRTDNGQ